MPDVTALELVNAVLNFHRFAEVTDFSRTETRVALQVVNMAIDKVLNSNDWEFAKRHDGILVTDASVSGVDGASGSVIFVDTRNFNLSPSISEGLPGSRTRFVNRQLPGVAGYAGEQGISYGLDSLRDLSGVTVGTVDTNWLGTLGGTTGDWVFYTAEYSMPAYVRGMISASKQNTGRLNIEMVSPELRLEELINEPAGHLTDETRILYQGGTLHSTSKGTPPSSVFGLRVILYPVPLTQFRIEYSYWYLYPQLVATTDTLEGISTSAIHDVVNWAYAHSNLTAIGNDAVLGAALKKDTRYEISETRRAEKAAMSYDGRIVPWGAAPGGHPGSRNPRWRWDVQRIEAP